MRIAPFLNSPASASLIHRLAYLGLLPFALLAALIWLVRPDLHPFVAHALSSYCALVIAFLGGIQWALGLMLGTRAPTLHFVWAAGVATLAWLSLLMPAYAGLPVQGLLLIACYLVDRKTWPTAGLASWLTLRFRLTAAATLCCLLGAAGT